MKYLITILLLVGVSVIFAQSTKSDAVFEKIIKDYTLNKDGSIDFHYYKRLKLLTHYSFNRLYGETFIVYDPTQQDLKINFCRTTHEDGKVTEAPFNAFNEVLPHFAADAPYYNQLREMVVTHPGTEVGAVLELDYNLVTNSGYAPGFMLDEPLTETSPVMDEEVIIRVPKTETFNYKVFNLRTAPEVSEEGDFRVFSFSFKGVKEASHEAHQPSNHTHLPRLICSTITWNEALAAVQKRMDWSYKTNEPMQEMVKKFRMDNQYDLPFILKLNEVVADQLNNYPISWTFTGFKARTPIQTWQSNGGTAIEKSILFAAMLRQAGINAMPVVIVPSKYYDEKIGCLPLVSEFLVQVNPRELEQMYLSATEVSDQNLVFKINGNTLIGLDPNQAYTETINEKFTNKVVTSGTMILDDSLKATGMIEVMMSEALNPYYTIEIDSAKVKSLLDGISVKEIESFKVINMAQYRSLADIVFNSAKAPKAMAQYYFYTLPSNKQGTEGWHINYLLPDRSDPFEVPSVINEQYSYEITLPAKTKLINPIELTEMKSDFGEIVLSTSQKDNKITVKRLLIITQQEIPVQQYDQFKQMMDLWNEENFRKLVLKRD